MKMDYADLRIFGLVSALTDLQYGNHLSKDERYMIANSPNGRIYTDYATIMQDDNTSIIPAIWKRYDNKISK